MEFAPQIAQDVHAAKALSIRRRFTTPGVHPFDTVEWELRDAHIGNGQKAPPSSIITRRNVHVFAIRHDKFALKKINVQHELAKCERSVKQMIGTVRRRHHRGLGSRAGTS